MNRILKYILGILVLAVLFTFARTAHAADIAQFQVSKPDGKPLKNMMVYVFNGDLYSQGSASELYPYGANAKTKPTYLGEVLTDDKGIFSLNPQNYVQQNLVFSSGSLYMPIGVEKAVDLAHTPSSDHIRIAEMADNMGNIRANHIYNWRTQHVVTIKQQGEPLPEKPAALITLKTFYLPRLAPKAPALTGSDIDHLRRQLEKPAYHPDLLQKSYSAITSNDAILRGFAATYLGKFGTYESVPYLIDALEDADIENAAALALKELTGENFSADSAKWKDWLAERNLVIGKIEKYLGDTGRTDLTIYRLNLNADKTHWNASLQKKNAPADSGTPALIVERNTGAIDFIVGQ